MAAGFTLALSATGMRAGAASQSTARDPQRAPRTAQSAPPAPPPADIDPYAGRSPTDFVLFEPGAHPEGLERPPGEMPAEGPDVVF